jgi:hypothetical protein
MYKYILNRNKQDSPSGENYEIHNEDACKDNLPLPENRISLGSFNNCQDALKKAKDTYPGSKNDIDACYWCCYSCHKE